MLRGRANGLILRRGDALLGGMEKLPVVIVGAGLAGLCCARTLHRAGVALRVFEQQDDIGGRVRTDVAGGYRFDRGFQVYLTAYEEGKRQLDYPALDLRPFEPGAGVYVGGSVQTVMDPWRRPGSLLDAALAKVGTLGDKLRVGALRARLQRQPAGGMYARPEQSTLHYLQAEGFSDVMIDRFFRPFFGGIFLDESLSTSSRMMEFVFRCFSLGDTAVPALGMQQIPFQLASGLPPECITLNTRVVAIDSTAAAGPSGEVRITLADGQEIPARAIVNAGPDSLFLPRAQGVRGQLDRSWRKVVNFYFSGAGETPFADKLLLLDGERGRLGPITNVACMSGVSSHYAPAGRYLLSCSCIGAGTIPPTPEAAQAQLATMFGESFARGLNLERTYDIPHALPDQSAPYYLQPHWPVRVSPGVYVCGDTHDTASIDGALKSGRIAAEAILADTVSAGR